MPSSAEYRTVAEVLELHDAPQSQIEFYAGKAEQLERRDSHARSLASFASHPLRQQMSEIARGAAIMQYLTACGWTPPEGLL